MHNNWEELLPFYVAGTLPKNEVARLERHLAGCAVCRKSLNEWRMIADVVRADAASQMSGLPPLSAQVLSIASEQAGERADQPIPFTLPPRRRYRLTAVTFAAAVFTVVLIGGLLTYLVVSGALPIQLATPNENVVLLPTETEPATATSIPSETVVPPTETTVPSQTSVLASATVMPSATTVPPSATTIPSQTTVPPSPTPIPPSATRVIQSATPIPPSATVVLPTPTPIPPSATRVPPTATTVPASATPRPQIIVVEPSATPVPPTTALLIPPTEIPPSTESLLFAEATPDVEMFSFQALSVNAACTIQGAVAGVALDLHAGPGDEYPIINAFTQDDVLMALAQSDNGWVRGQYSFDDVNVWIGWVRADQVFLSGECANLPLVTASEAPVDSPPDTRTLTPPDSTDEPPVEATPEIETTLESVAPTDAPAPISDTPAVVVTASVANLRSGPGTGYPIITTARAGARFPVSAQTTTASGVWYLVQRPSQTAVWVAASVARLTPSGAFVSPALTIPPPNDVSAAETDQPFPTPEIASGTWSQTVTILTTSCTESLVSGGTVPVSLLAEGDIITVFSADAGSPFAVSRIGTQTYSGSYVTATASVSISLTFTSATSYSGSAVATQTDGCVVQSALSGIYAG